MLSILYIMQFAALSTDRRAMTRANSSLFIHFRNNSACESAPCPAKTRAENFCCPYDGIYEEGNPGWGRFTQVSEVEKRHIQHTAASTLTYMFFSQFPTHKNMRLWLWDYRNQAASDYFLSTRILGELGLGSAHVDGFFTDDPAGLG